jgi:SAM-dependent methyltransferase
MDILSRDQDQDHDLEQGLEHADRKHHLVSQIIAANKTSRSSGAIGKRAIVPRYIKENFKPFDAGRILDFGSGKGAIHTLKLRELGFVVDAYDFGSNRVKDLHVPELQEKAYDLVFASNVLNIQQDRAMCLLTLQEIFAVLKPGGKFICNYPSNPRHNPMSDRELFEHLCSYGNFKVVEFSSKTPVYVVTCL